MPDATDVADHIFRFAPIDLDQAQYASVHGANEHIKIQNVGQCVCFYKNLIKAYSLSEKSKYNEESER